jgi:ParB-like chromosome segregation protein Spo0J
MNIVIKKIADLKASEYNPRLSTSKQNEDMDKSLNMFGFVDPVIINTYPGRENVIIGGHFRTRRWKHLGYDEVPCIELKLTLEEEKELNIRLNKNTGDFDYQLLEKEFDRADLLDWGFEPSDFPDIKEPTITVSEHERKESETQDQLLNTLIDCHDQNGNTITLKHFTIKRKQ